MSETAQEQQTIAPTPEEMAAADAAAAAEAAAAAPEPQADRSNTRSYTLFEEARQDTWTKLGAVEAATPEAALDTLGEAKLKESAQGKRFMAIPSRFVVPKKPKVDTVTTITYD